MTTPYSFNPFETIRATDVNRALELIRQGIDVNKHGILDAISGKIRLVDLSPSLQALVLRIVLFSSHIRENFTVTVPATQDFTMAGTPIPASEVVSLNGQILQWATEYSLSGNVLHIITPSTMPGDLVEILYYATSSIVVAPVENYQVGLRRIMATIPTLSPVDQEMYFMGYSKVDGRKKIAKYETINLVQLGAMVDVNSGTPDSSPFVITTYGGFTYGWAIGDSNVADRKYTVTKVNLDNMTTASTIVLHDTNFVVSSLATNNAFVYAFVKGGSSLDANSVAIIDAFSNVVTGFIGHGGGITSTDATDMVIGPDGFLYVAYSRTNGSVPNRGQIRKFNVATGAMVQAWTLDSVISHVTHPIKIIATNNSVLVLDDTAWSPNLGSIYEIDLLGVVTRIPLTVGPATDLMYDGSDLWMSVGTRLYKLSRTGTILNSVILQPSLNITNIVSALGMVWTTYANDTLTTDTNLTKVFPGLPGEP